MPDLWCGALFAVGTSPLRTSKTRLRLRTLCLHPYALPTACWKKLRAVESGALAWSTLRRSFLIETRRRLRLCMSAFFVLHCVGSLRYVAQRQQRRSAICPSNMFCTHGVALRAGLSCLTCGVPRSLPMRTLASASRAWVVGHGSRHHVASFILDASCQRWYLEKPWRGSDFASLVGCCASGIALGRTDSHTAGTTMTSVCKQTRGSNQLCKRPYLS